MTAKVSFTISQNKSLREKLNYDIENLQSCTLVRMPLTQMKFQNTFKSRELAVKLK